MIVREVLDTLVASGTLTEPQSRELMEELLGGRLEDATIGAVLALLARRGPTVDELLGAARAMRAHVTPIPGAAQMTGALIDTCGTGGARKTFNISTLAAIVAASAGEGKVLVAKHGNRGRSGRGSAEVLRGLGVNVDASPTVQARCLRKTRVCFCFAVHHHPAMKHAARARAALGFPTIFNLLGPLTNPAGAPRQVMGVYARDLVERIAQVLAKLECTRAMVVHSDDGLDEISTRGPTTIAHVEHGSVRLERFDPKFLGLPVPREDELDALDLDDAVRIARDVLGGVKGPPRDIVLLNASAALLVAGAAPDWPTAFATAAGAIDAGKAAATLDLLARTSHEP
ncbi:MAG: anthranilate phosphoribosyltransferase [Phycisphaerae bacterium]|nr:MAG: anthranilate phosphoribosyltransferase [Phycisphaerae bacterium]